ncbi:MAG: hypothetical protein ACXVB4_06850 [Pseudobdellovibrionaceae bacterium]
MARLQQSHGRKDSRATSLRVGGLLSSPNQVNPTQAKPKVQTQDKKKPTEPVGFFVLT